MSVERNGSSAMTQQPHDDAPGPRITISPARAGTLGASVVAAIVIDAGRNDAGNEDGDSP